MELMLLDVIYIYRGESRYFKYNLEEQVFFIFLVFASVFPKSFFFTLFTNIDSDKSKNFTNKRFLNLEIALEWLGKLGVAY